MIDRQLWAELVLFRLKRTGALRLGPTPPKDSLPPVCDPVQTGEERLVELEQRNRIGGQMRGPQVAALLRALQQEGGIVCRRGKPCASASALAQPITSLETAPCRGDMPPPDLASAPTPTVSPTLSRSDGQDCPHPTRLYQSLTEALLQRPQRDHSLLHRMRHKTGHSRCSPFRPSPPRRALTPLPRPWFLSPP